MPTKKIALKKKVVTNTKVTPKKKGFVTGSIVAIGASVAAIGAGAYYFFGPKGKRHQKDAKIWMIRMKTDVSKRLDKAEKATEKTYHEIVDGVAREYTKHGEAEVSAFTKKLKAQWKSIEKSTKKPSKQAVKGVKKTTGKK